MRLRESLKQSVHLIVLTIVALGAVAARPGSTDEAAAAAMLASDFVPMASKGFYFGEGSDVEQDRRQNSYAWSMKWWKGKLYVATGRSTQCVQVATLTRFYPDTITYPAGDPTVDCEGEGPREERKPWDQGLRAEIWRWTPGPNTWERVFQSPRDVPVPDPDPAYLGQNRYLPGKFVARDIGFRDMVVVTEPDGTEALYLSGVSSRSFNSQVPPFHPNWPSDMPQDMPSDMPPPRILRSTDGVNFEPIPINPDTFSNTIGFRSLASYNGRLYVVASDGFLGQGPVYEADDPARANFKQISLDGLTFYELTEYNGLLYLGGGNRGTPYALWKTNARGALPYNLTPVVTNGGWSPNHPDYPSVASQSVVSMHVFKGRLYVGTDRPAEILRINPDDSWDLIVGAPRDTTQGRKEPLSGMGAGFDWPLNFHMWRMQSHDDVLYVSTFDQSTHWDSFPVVSRVLREKMGFDLYSSEDGNNFTMVTQTGFGDKYDVGGRTFASTPCGLILGGVNQSYGFKIWRTGGANPTCNFPLYLPMVPVADGSEGSPGASPATVAEPQAGPIQPPQTIDGEIKDGTVVLSWAAPPEATAFRVFRAEFTLDQHLAATDSQLVAIDDQLVVVTDEMIAADDKLGLADVESDLWIPGSFVEIGATDQAFFIDRAIAPDKFYHYYVLAEDRDGAVSDRSTLVRLPALASAVTFTNLESTVAEWSTSSTPGAPDASAPGGEVDGRQGRGKLREAAARAKKQAEAGDLTAASRELEQLQQAVTDRPALLDAGRAADLEILLAKLQRRMALVRLKILAPSDLLQAPPTAK